MQHPRYMSPEAVEAMRAEAKGVKGVYYDSRSNRFVSDIMVRGVKVRLGSFNSVVDASEAYQNAKRHNPSAERGSYAKRNKPTVQGAYAEFRAARPEPEPGDSWSAPDGQSYVFQGVKATEGSGVFSRHFVFTSSCRTCGEPFETAIAADPLRMNGANRNCAEHRDNHPYVKLALARQAVRAEKALAAGPVFTEDDAGLAEQPLITEAEYLTRMQNRAKREGRAIPTQMTQAMLDGLEQANGSRLAARAKRDARKAWEDALALGVGDLV